MRKLMFSLLFVSSTTLSAYISIHAQVADGKPDVHSARNLPIEGILESIRKDARKDFSKTADALRALNPETMNDEDHGTWVRLSRETAIRTGSTDLLIALKDYEDPFSTIAQGRIILANGYVETGAFNDANDELSRIKNLDQINTRDRRRYWALKARIAQLTGNEGSERMALDKVVQELSHWPGANCQGCHNDPKNPAALPPLNFKSLWFFERYVELLKRGNEAEPLRRAMEKRLADTPQDMDARIHLVAALTALGLQQEAEQTLDAIAWSGRRAEGAPAPRLIFAWP